MKILKILLIVLVPALGIVSCKKSGLKPSCSNSTEKTTASDSNGSTDRIIGESDVISEGQGTEVIGSGDDDRDGGDKKNKKTVK